MTICVVCGRVCSELMVILLISVWSYCYIDCGFTVNGDLDSLVLIWKGVGLCLVICACENWNIGFHALWMLVSFLLCLRAWKAMLSQHSWDFSRIHPVAANRQSSCLLSVSNMSSTLTFLICTMDSPQSQRNTFPVRSEEEGLSQDKLWSHFERKNNILTWTIIYTHLMAGTKQLVSCILLMLILKSLYFCSFVSSWDLVIVVFLALFSVCIKTNLMTPHYSIKDKKIHFFP